MKFNINEPLTKNQISIEHKKFIKNIIFFIFVWIVLAYLTFSGLTPEFFYGYTFIWATVIFFSRKEDYTPYTKLNRDNGLNELHYLARKNKDVFNYMSKALEEERNFYTFELTMINKHLKNIRKQDIKKVRDLKKLCLQNRQYKKSKNIIT